MKRSYKSAACILLAAGMVMSTSAPLVQDLQTGIVAYAGDNDFSWSAYSKKDASWWKSSEATALADEMIAYQLWDGGWRKDMKTETTGSWNKSTIDNNATWGQIRFLASVYNATGTEKYKTACLKGLDLLINGQYSNGGWPQVFNDAGTYHAHITFNDTAMVAVLKIMLDVSQKSGPFAWVDSSYQSKADNAVNNGIKCILNSQIKVNGTLTAWCQQHDEFTLAPAGARAYELPSICTSESVGIVDFMRSLPDSKKSPEVIRSINAAVKWFDSVKIENRKWGWNSDHSDKVVTYENGSTIWARFYDLQNSKPMFADRDGQVYYDVTQISYERRTGYSWYGTWCANNIKLGTLPETSTTPTTQGTHLYVGYSNKANNYSTIQAAVDAAAAKNPSSEETRVSIHIAPGTYREQVRVNTPYISFINDEPSKEVKITWYYGIGYKYYSMGSDGYYNASNAWSKSSKGEPTRWGSAVALHTKASHFRAEYITFENSFNRYVTDEELADGVEVSGSESITFQRYKGADVKSKTATERAAAIAVEGDYSEFYKCNFLGSQDTLFTRGAHEYYRDCRIEGNTDYIFGQGQCVFQNCDLVWTGYTDKAVGGYITAAKSDGKYLFSGCNVYGASGMMVGSGHFGRPWGAAADVAFVDTKLAYESIITSAGWTSMSGNMPENANFKEYNTTVNGTPVNTSGRVSGTVRYSANGLDVNTYLNGWSPYYYSNSGSSQPITIDPINGTLVKQLVVNDTQNGADWSIGYNFGSGSKLFGDRDFTAVSVPASLTGAEAIKTACDSKTVTSDLGTFTAGADITVYTAVDSRVTGSLPSWLSGWEKTGEAITTSNDLTMELFKKTFSSGSKVTLGTNGGSTGCVNYIVLVTENAPEPINGKLIKNLVVNDRENAADWSISYGFGNGSTIFGDRDFTVQGVPSNLANAEVIKTACDSKMYTGDLATFTAGSDITLYAAVDTRVNTTLDRLKSWTAVGTSLTTSNDVELALYKLDVKSGTKVTLGTNGAEGYSINYVVMAVPQEKTNVDPGNTSDLYPVVKTQVKDHKIGFKWNKIPGAEKYGIGVYQAKKWVVKKQLDGSVTTWTSPQVSNGTYRLVVLAKVNGKWVNADVFKRSFYVTVN